MSHERIDPVGATYLLLAMLLAKVFTVFPRMIAMKASTSAWLVVLLAGFVGLGEYWFLYALLRRFPGRSLAARNHPGGTHRGGDPGD